MRWLTRWLDETEATLDESVLVVAELAALGGASTRCSA
jgi:hypothetical protein